MEKEMKNRSNYSQEFKDQAVKLSYESGKTRCAG
jgi:transposase-like protein